MSFYLESLTQLFMPAERCKSNSPETTTWTPLKAEKKVFIVEWQLLGEFIQITQPWALQLFVFHV